MSTAHRPPRAVGPSVNGWNAEYVESQYRAWRDDPDAVAPDLAQFFRGFDLAVSLGGGAPEGVLTQDERLAEDHKQAAVSHLIEEYRRLGNRKAEIDPFGREREDPASLHLDHHGLSEGDLDREFDAGSLAAEGGALTLGEIVRRLEETYCGSIAAEFTHIANTDERRWLADRMEHTANRPALSPGERAHVLFQLHKAELFERYCGRRYPGVKRFSLEGGESLIPMLDRFVERAGDSYDVEELVIAMSHRGRLNVLTNVVGKTYEQIFTEFEDAWDEDSALGGGDVKYHRGYSSSRVLPSGKHVWIALMSNPSHLESVYPVALGRCRAKQRLRGDTERSRVLPIVMHGDAAVVGQGVVAECFNLSQLPGYTVGGSVHIVVNNLIGFTTSKFDARSSKYCTDFAKGIDAPILHVNGEDPEACVHAIELALDYRMEFKKDVVIDLVCYRRHGHNETDEAAFTQPLLYKEIKAKPSVLTTYAERLLAEGVISEDDRAQLRSSLDEELDRAFESARKTPVDPTPNPGHQRWSGVEKHYSHTPVRSAVPRDELNEIAEAMGRWPDSFTPHPKLTKLLTGRRDAVVDDKAIDWATAESLAVGSLLLEGVIVRMSGQDSRRGTFSQRHAVLRDHETGDIYTPLNGIREQGVAGTDKEVGTVNELGQIRQAKYCIYDSPLSEFGVLGFEYGFSLASPNMLVMWEAQFGDFVNGAQVIIDQFIASAEAKWQRWSGLVMLLPHGYEGQGPEHSSARLERFLKLCSQNNMQVCYPSTPAQYFHMLRRQVLRKFRKPLIVMTPKSLLRLPAATSRVADLTAGQFDEIIDDPAFAGDDDAAKKVRRVLLCTGKVYYDLVKRREEAVRDDLAIVRLEQVYPLHEERFAEIRARYPDAELVWVQEEPQNMGAWAHMRLTFEVLWGLDLPYVGREASASPATGSPKRHAQELDDLLTDAVGPKPAGGGRGGQPKGAKAGRGGGKKTGRDAEQAGTGDGSAEPATPTKRRGRAARAGAA